MMEEFNMSIAYGILCVISLVLIGVCLAVDRKKDICLLLLFGVAPIFWFLRPTDKLLSFKSSKKPYY